MSMSIYMSKPYAWQIEIHREKLKNPQIYKVWHAIVMNTFAPWVEKNLKKETRSVDFISEFRFTLLQFYTKEHYLWEKHTERKIKE